MDRKWGRRIVQVISAVLYNANFAGFKTGALYRGAAKNICAPGLNCYSCPGATMACPLGSLQTALGTFPKAVPLYALGFLILSGALLGRAICAFLCPFGLLQELFYMLPTPKVKKNRVTRALSCIKYVVLAVFVFALPVYYLITSGVVSPAFCRFICPAGTLEGAIPMLIAKASMFELAGWTFILKTTILALVIALAVFVYRPFCRFICPLGAIYSFFNGVAVFGVRVDAAKCNGCGACVRACKMDVRKVNDRECIRCGECRGVCPTGAIGRRTCKRRKKDA